MAEEKEQTKYRRSNGTTTSTKKLKTYKKLPIAILIVLILLVSLIVYITVSYQNGIKYAEEHAKDVKIHKFNGPIKMMGKFQC